MSKGFRITSISSANKAIASQKNKQKFGSKILKLGTEYSILFPKKDGELVVAGIVGYNCDYKSLGVSFCKPDDSQLVQNKDTGRLTDNSGMHKWAMLSNILYKAKMNYEIEQKKNSLEDYSQRSGKPIDATAMSNAIDAIKRRYLGESKTAEHDAVLPTESRLISSNLEFCVSTEAVVVPLGSDLTPMVDDAIAVEIQLSKAKINQLAQIMSNKVYDSEDPNGFLEIKFAYKGEDAKIAGRNPYQGCEVSVRKFDFSKDENGEYISPITKAISPKLSDITHDEEIMYNRSGSIRWAVSVSELESCMRKYLANNNILSVFIDFQDDYVKKNAKALLEFDTLFSKDSNQYKQLQSIVYEQERGDDSEESLLIDSTLPGELNSVIGGTTVSEVNSTLNTSGYDIPDLE